MSGHYRWSFTVLLLAVMVVGCGPQQFKTDLFRPFEYHNSLGPRALAWDGRDFVIGSLNQTVYARGVQTKPYFIAKYFWDEPIYYQNGRLPVQVGGGGKSSICGMAWEGECCEFGFLWVADAALGKISKLDPGYNPIVSFSSPGPSPSGMTFDGSALWVADTADSAIFKLSPANGEIMSTLASPVARPAGLAYHCDGLWVVGMDSCKRGQKGCLTPRLVQIDEHTGQILKEIQIPAQIGHPSALLWKDGVLWVGDEMSGRVYKIKAA